MWRGAGRKLICGVSRRMKLEKELVAQLWRISWDDIQLSNFDKVRRSGSKLTLSLVSTVARARTHTHVHTLTGVCVHREGPTTAL